MLKKLLAVIGTAVILLNSSALTASAEEPYDVYNYDRWGDAVPSQAGYITERVVSGKDLGIGELSKPQDIFRDSSDRFYIVDTGNDRIIVTNPEFSEVSRIYDSFTLPDSSVTPLKKPTGVFVSEYTELMYIADSNNSRVLVCDLDGNVVREIVKPVSEVYDQSKTFLPQKVLADKAGNVYVVLENITSGAAMFSPDGDFIGFYGANRVEATAEIVEQYFLNFFTPEEKRAHRTRNVPTGISGFDIEGDFIFTCTSSTTQKTDTVKKLNAAGDNIFRNLDVTYGDYTPMYDPNTNTSYAARICDIDIGDDGSINCLDATTGRVFQYDKECSLLFICGTLSKTQAGGFEQAAAVESMDGRLYVLDKAKNSVTIFTETAFGSIVHEATSLYNQGRYEEALEPWYEVLRRDGNYRRAYIGAASALLNKGEYKKAMKYARLADAPYIYNKAFEGYRSEFIREHFTELLCGLALLTAALIVLSRRSRKKRRAFEEKELAERLERRENAGKEEQQP